MKKFIVLSAAALLAVGMSSCQSQRTLAQATAVANPSTDATEVAPVEYVAKTAPEEAPAPAPVVMPGDRQEKVSVVDNTDNSVLKDYNVIVGSFGNKTNADNMKAKMAGRGYNAFLVQNASGMYRVVAGSFGTREAATAVRDVIRNTYPTEAGTCAEAWLLIPER